MFAAVFLLCRDRTVTEDATQEAFARAFERWDRLAAVPWAGGWVTTTAMNVARRSLRRRFPGLQSQRPSEIDATVELWDAVARLPLRQQEAVVLHYRLGTPVDEVAELMRCEPGTVRTHLARARTALRRALRGEDAHGF